MSLAATSIFHRDMRPGHFAEEGGGLRDVDDELVRFPDEPDSNCQTINLIVDKRCYSPL
jgi:hypothetical protein